VQAGEEKAEGDLINMCKYLIGGCKEDTANCQWAKIEIQEIPLKYQNKCFFPASVVQHGIMLPRELVGSPSLKAVKFKQMQC